MGSLNHSRPKGLVGFSVWLEVAEEGPEVNSGMACGFMFLHTIAPDTLPEI